ncbi:YdeI/OmpD-associated family protein [Pontibacter sp. G13]|uniref:YdeI/OmpD-associated family protein n=1 Tax=Pontibacter sp. G13 TaxID=3074898 RepID=UPI00288BE41E|nr:YdeI/OmpD-associated family protein [Pontibacter sp. G13]WNJ18166.1 YdeI/OmpD-associated family protein [Pontibacter sp. G13]
MSKPLVSRICLLEKFPGKGGWTYIALPEILPDPHAHFGWVRVHGEIDGVAVPHAKLWPLKGRGTMFSVSAKLRKAIGKAAGDEAHLELYLDDRSIEIPPEIRDSLALESEEVQGRFEGMEQDELRQWMDWIYRAKDEDGRIDRIARLIQCLAVGRSFAQK